MTRKHPFPSRLALASAATFGAAALILATAPARAGGPDGAALFRQRCATCHTTPALAPPLAGVLGRKAAAAAFAYSPALKSSGLTWDRKTLDRFLAGPQQLVPGTRMVIAVSDPAQRKAIVDFLATPAR